MEIGELFNADMQSFMDETPEANVVETSVETTEEKLEDEIISHVDDEALVETQEQNQGTVGDEEAEQQGQEGSVAKDTSSLLFSFASTLVEEGALPSLDLENANIESTEDLVEAMKAEIKAKEFSDLTELQREALVAMRNGIPAESFIKNKRAVSELTSLSDNDLEQDLEIRKALIKKDFLSKGYSSERADKFTQRSIDLGEDLEDAKEALHSQKRLLKSELDSQLEQNKIKQKEQEAQYQKQLDSLRETVYNEESEIIPGMKFNKRIADQVYSSMTEVVDEVDGQKINKIMKARMEDPVGFEHKLHYLFNITKGFKDFSKLTKTAKTAAVKSFEEKLNLNSIAPKKKSHRGNDLDLGFLERELM